MEITVTINGQQHRHDVEPRTLLVNYIRDTVGLVGTNIGCDTSSCGACTIHLGGESVKSCTMFAVQANGEELLTIEGLADGAGSDGAGSDGAGSDGAADGPMHPMQEAFRSCHALQCGYCTPGMVMAAVSLLKENPNPSEREVRLGLEGNLCRCTGYHNIVKAVLECAQGGQNGKGGAQ